jgi:hypothetical protein
VSSAAALDDWRVVFGDHLRLPARIDVSIGNVIVEIMQLKEIQIKPKHRD